jgi:hypothetical protein
MASIQRDISSFLQSASPRFSRLKAANHQKLMKTAFPASVRFGLPHQVPGERLEIGELLRVPRGYDESEMMPIAFAALGKGTVIGIIVSGIEHPTRSAVLGYAFAPEIGHVSAKRRSPGSVPYDACFDGNAACAVGHQPRGRDTRGPAAAEGTTAAAAPGSTLQSSGLLGFR